MYVFCNSLVQKNTMSTLVLKKPLFSQIWGHFSVHKSEILKFLAWIHMEYFYVGIFEIPGVCLIWKYGSQTTAFFSVFQCFSGYREAKYFVLFPSLFSKTAALFVTLFLWLCSWLTVILSKLSRMNLILRSETEKYYSEVLEKILHIFKGKSGYFSQNLS